MSHTLVHSRTSGSNSNSSVPYPTSSSSLLLLGPIGTDRYRQNTSTTTTATAILPQLPFSQSATTARRGALTSRRRREFAAHSHQHTQPRSAARSLASSLFRRVVSGRGASSKVASTARNRRLSPSPPLTRAEEVERWRRRRWRPPRSGAIRAAAAAARLPSPRARRGSLPLGPSPGACCARALLLPVAPPRRACYLTLSFPFIFLLLYTLFTFYILLLLLLLLLLYALHTHALAHADQQQQLSFSDALFRYKFL